MAYPIFDLHCDTADRLAWQTFAPELRSATGMEFYGPGDAEDPAGCRELLRNHGHISLEKIGAAPWAQCFACFVPDELSPEQARAFYEQVTSSFDGELARNASAVSPIGASREIRPVLEGARDGEPHVAAIRTIENARMFSADLTLVERYAARGLLMASLSWNAQGPLASGHDTHEGLSSLGLEALRLMEREGVVLDVSHLNDECFSDVARASERPFVASHSNARAVCGHKRNLTDAQFGEIRARGGIVGLNFCTGFLVDDAWDERGERITFDEIAAHIEHWLELGGEDVIALGGDFDGASVPALLNGADKLPAFAQSIEQRFGATVAAKFCYQNALAFFERNGR